MNCQGTTAAGTPCKSQATEGAHCRHHQPKSEAYTPPETVIEVREVTPPVASSDAYAIAAAARDKSAKKRNRTGALTGQVLIAEQIPGMSLRWVNGNDIRLAQMIEKGYTFVDDNNKVISSNDVGARKSMLVGTGKDDQPRRDYLMQIPVEFYEEDQQLKENRIRQTEAATKAAIQGGDALGSGSNSVAYDPTGGNSQFDVG